MLEWFGKRLRHMQEVKRDERGFTLIELLVVVIIVGVLAAVAIPVFLNQAEKAKVAAVKSDVRNAVTMNTAMESDTGTGIANGTYNAGAQIGSGDNSFRVSDGVTITVSATAISGAHADTTGAWTYTKASGLYSGTNDFS